MKSYSEPEKSLLNSICQNVDGHSHFGGEIIRQAFIDASVACLLVKEKNEGWIFSSPTSGDSQSESLSKVVWLLSFFEYCEHLNYIYCVENDDYNAIMFCTCDNVVLGVEKEGKKYSNTDDETIEVCEHTATWKDKDGKLKIEGYRCPQNLIKAMKHYFASAIFPTSTLLELKANDYKTSEELSLTKQLKDAKRNLHIAYVSLIISLSMPILSVFISNRWGYTTIEKTQHEEIARLLDSLNVQNTKKSGTFKIGTIKVMKTGKQNNNINSK